MIFLAVGSAASVNRRNSLKKQGKASATPHRREE